MRRLLLCALALSALAPGATPGGEPDVRSRVDELFREYDRSDSPGCALGVFRDGKIEYARGYGMANLELGVANTPQTVFDIGSTSKQFTAFAIQLLARDGKLSLDDDVRKWVPEIPSYGKTVTIRHLLHHTGGLRDYIELMSLQGVMTEDLTVDADVLDIMARQKAPNFAPGEEHLYCNTGYFLLSVIVKRASGQSLRDFAAERIFGPLGMRHTQFNDSHTRIIPNRATGYSKGKDGVFGIDMSDWEQTGDGAVATTVEDLQRWDQNFYDPKVGDAKVLEAMHEVGVLNSGKKLEYASALYVEHLPGAAGRQPRRLLGGLPRAAHAVSEAEAVGRVPLQQRRDGQPEPARAEGRRGLPRRPDDAGRGQTRSEVRGAGGRRSRRVRGPGGRLPEPREWRARHAFARERGPRGADRREALQPVARRSECVPARRSAGGPERARVLAGRARGAASDEGYDDPRRTEASKPRRSSRSSAGRRERRTSRRSPERMPPRSSTRPGAWSPRAGSSSSGTGASRRRRSLRRSGTPSRWRE